MWRIQSVLWSDPVCFVVGSDLLQNYWSVRNGLIPLYLNLEHYANMNLGIPNNWIKLFWSKNTFLTHTLCRISGLDRELQQKRRLPANTKPAAEDLRGKSADGCAWLSPSFHRSWICLVQQASRRCSAGGQLSINYYIYSMMTCQITAFWFSERGNRDFIRAKR